MPTTLQRSSLARLTAAQKILGLQSRLSRVEGRQAEIRRQIQVLKLRYAKLESVRRRLVSKIERARKKLERIAGINAPRDIVREVERQINSEGFMEDILTKRFKSQAEHGPGSRRWAPLAKSTIARKGFNRILVDTKEMYFGALIAVGGTFRLGRRPRWDVYEIGADYAQYHQTGTDRMPARPFFNPPTDKELIPAMRRAEQLLRAYMRKAGNN